MISCRYTTACSGLEVDHAPADRPKGKTGLTTRDREERVRLRKENREFQATVQVIRWCRLHSIDKEAVP